MDTPEAPPRRAQTGDVPSEAISSMPSGPALMAIGGRLVPGELRSANLEIGFADFVPTDPDTPAPTAGEAVRLSFGEGTRFSAASEIVEAEGGHWFLTLPTNLAPATARRATRQPANGDWQFVTDSPDSTFESEVHDISPDGIGLLLAPDEPIGSAGRMLHGRLIRIDGPSIPVVAEVRNMRRHAHSPDWKVVGCALRLKDAERAALATLIAEDA